MAALKLVLDTNVVIDWLVFDDPYLAAFRGAVLRGDITVVTQPQAVFEFRRVLTYRALKLDEARQSRILREYRERTVPYAGAADPVPKGFPRCRDPDDAPFLSLAWRAKADALVSRDKEVLALRRRTTRFGFRILDVPGLMERVGALSAGGSSSSPAV